MQITATFWNGIIADHAASQLRATEAVTPKDTYRGWEIWCGRWPEPEWSATSPNYDASYEGPEDGWVDNGESATGSTREELIENIDAWFEENSHASS